MSELVLALGASWLASSVVFLPVLLGRVGGELSDKLFAAFRSCRVTDRNSNVAFYTTHRCDVGVRLLGIFFFCGG
jgi:hypothetical protein